MAKGKEQAVDLKTLNWYHLQKAMYAAWARYDRPETKDDGRKEIQAVYAEYARRGIQKVAMPKI